MWTQLNLFSEDEPEQSASTSESAFSTSAYLHPNVKLSESVVARLQCLDVMSFAQKPAWQDVLPLLQRLNLKTLADVVKIQESAIIQMRTKPQSRKLVLKRFRKDIIDHADSYIKQGEQPVQKNVVTIDENDLKSISSLFEAIENALGMLVKSLCEGGKMGKRAAFYEAVFVKHQGIDGLTIDGKQVTMERKRQVVRQFLHRIVSDEGFKGFQIDKKSVQRLQERLKALLYTSETMEKKPAYGTISFLREWGYDLLEMRESEDKLDFVAIVKQEGVSAMRQIIRLILKMLYNQPVPIPADELIAGVLQKAGNVAMDDKEEAVRCFLRTNPWIEHVDNRMIRLETSHLSLDYVRYARIIYDAHAPIHISRITSEFERLYHERPKSQTLSLVKKNFTGFLCYGKTGYWEYVGLKQAESPILLHRLRQRINDGSLGDTFYLKDIMAMLTESERKVYSCQTISAYVSVYAVKDLNDAEHFCLRGKETLHPEYVWYNEHDFDLMPSLISRVVELLTALPRHTFTVSLLKDYLINTMKKETDEKHLPKVRAHIYRLLNFIAPSKEEAISRRLPFYVHRQEGRACVAVCEENVKTDSVTSFTLKRRNVVRSMFESLYAYAREILLCHESHEMEMQQIIRQFMQTDGFKSHADAAAFSDRRLRGAFANNLVPKVFQIVKHENDKGVMRIFVRLVMVEE